MKTQFKMIHFVCTRKGEMNNFTQIRGGRREKYFGHKTHENLSKLTDLLFKERRDNYFLASILGGSTEYIEEDELDTYLDELIQEKLQDETIDWKQSIHIIKNDWNMSIHKVAKMIDSIHTDAKISYK